MSKPKIGVIGLGYVGLSFLAALANVDYKIVGLDINKGGIRALQQSYRADIYEPGLNESLERHKDNIEFTSDYGFLMKECDAIFITVGTPINEESNTVVIENNIADVETATANHLRRGQLLVLKSTVSPGRTREFAKNLQQASGLEAGTDFYVTFSPERTIEGASLNELRTIPKIVGGINQESTDKAAAILESLGAKIIKVSSSEVAELAKLIDNCYRAMNIAFANEIGYICEKIGLDMEEVRFASNTAYERTNLFQAGLGAGGTCLTKDPKILAYFAKMKGIDVKTINASIIQNKESTLRIASLASQFITANEIKRPKFSFLGLAFKGSPETDDVRESPTVEILHTLKENFPEAEFSFYDPIIKRFIDKPIVQSLAECLNSSHVVMFLTNHRSLMNIEVEDILKNTARPLLIIDCWRNLINPTDIKEKGVKISRIGDGRL